MTNDVDETTRRMLEQVALTVAPMDFLDTSSASTGTYRSMATLINSQYALTPYSALPTEGHSGNRRLMVTFPNRLSGKPVPVEVETIFSDLDLLLLKLAYPQTDAQFEIHPPGTWKDRGSRWFSLFVTPNQPNGELITGTVMEAIMRGNRFQLTLAAEGLSRENRHVSGAPVIIDGKVWGVLKSNSASFETGQFVAYPIPDLNDLLPSQIQIPVPERKPAELNTEEFFRALGRRTGIPAIAAAKRLTEAFKESALHMEYLIAGIYLTDNSPLKAIMRAKGIPEEAFIQVIAKEHGSSIWRQRLAEGALRTPPLEKLPRFSNHIKLAFIGAQNAAWRENADKITARHLLIGALSVTQCSTITALASHGITMEDAMRIQPANRATTDRRAPEHTPVHADTATANDLLDIKREVEALSQVIASRDVEPPLSIGLFGDWGSSKSTFMKLMEGSIKSKVEMANGNQARRADGSRIYCENVVQIWFNAWHYIDASLWASLTSEIFHRLAEQVQDKRENDPTLVRERILSVSRNAASVLADAEQRRSEATEELRRSTERLENLKGREKKVEFKLTHILREAYHVVMENTDAKKDLEAAARALNISQVQQGAGEMKAQLLELRENGGFLRATELAFHNRQLRQTYGGILAAIVLFVLVISAGRAIGAEGAIGDTIRWAAGIVGGVIGFILPYLVAANRAITSVKRIWMSSQKEIDNEIASRRQALETEREQLAKNLKSATAEVDSSKQLVAEYQLRLEMLRADRQMVDYIRKRNESGDYTKHLGVIASARNDFKSLSDLLERAKAEKEQRERTKPKVPANGSGAQPEAGANIDGEVLDLPHVDRIILYIDDLDRCPEERVVEVLQAVHLLLAFKLFVVVVGVDARWLLRSLKRHTGMLHDPGNAPTDGTAQAPADDPHWQSTPINYLEKIFQIPFTLRPMRQGGFHNLIDSLAGNGNTSTQPAKTDDQPNENAGMANGTGTGNNGAIARELLKPSEPQAGAESGAPNGTGTTGEAPTGTTPKQPAGQQQPGDVAAQANAEFLQITDGERTVMKNLYLLIPSPRATKRFVNIYRLLRASVYHDKRADFIGDAARGKHHAVLMLLAIMTGSPNEAADILEALIKQRPTESWWSFIGTFEARTETGCRVNDADGTPLRTITHEEAAGWRDLLGKLGELRTLDTPIPAAQLCDDFIEYAPEVARYSFQSGRLFFAATETTAVE